MRRFADMMPLVLLGILVGVLALSVPSNDITTWFAPAARLMANGADVYSLSTRGAFVYPPIAVWVFIPFTLSIIYHAILFLNTALVIWMVNTLRISRWWFLYPPVLVVLYLGQIDLIICALALVAYRRRWGVLMAVVMLIKPQVAIFWCIPLILEQPRLLLRMAIAGVLALGISIVVMSEMWVSWIMTLVRDWQFLSAGIYVDGMSLPGLWVFAFILLLILRPRGDRARAWTALSVPMTRYYNAVGLLGYGSTGIVALSWLLYALWIFARIRTVYWIEPLTVVLLGMLSEYLRRKRQSQLDYPPSTAVESVY